MQKAVVNIPCGNQLDNSDNISFCVYFAVFFSIWFVGAAFACHQGGAALKIPQRPLEHVMNWQLPRESDGFFRLWILHIMWRCSGARGHGKRAHCHSTETAAARRFFFSTPLPAVAHVPSTHTLTRSAATFFTAPSCVPAHIHFLHVYESPETPRALNGHVRRVRLG